MSLKSSNSSVTKSESRRFDMAGSVVGIGEAVDAEIEYWSKDQRRSFVVILIVMIILEYSMVIDKKYHFLNKPWRGVCRKSWGFAKRSSLRPVRCDDDGDDVRIRKGG